MPEARDRLPGGGTGNMALGFGIRRGFYVAAQPRIGHEGHTYRSLSDNKENIPPESSRSRRRQTRPRKSPLPSWYPRTPLRDITAVVNAMERRRNRLRAAAELRRRNQETANSSPFPLLTSPLPHELSDSEQTPPPIQDQEPLVSTSDLYTDPSASPLPHELGDSEQTPPPIQDQGRLLSTSDLSPGPSAMMKNHPQTAKNAENSLQSSSSIENSVSHDKNAVAADKNFFDSIDEIERVVMENIQRMVNRTTKKSERSTLMSMR